MTEPTTLTAQIEALPTHAHENRHGAVISRSVDRDAVLSLVRTHEAQAEAVMFVRGKMLRYIAFVATGDEMGDPQLGVDRLKAERDALRAEVERVIAIMFEFNRCGYVDGRAVHCRPDNIAMILRQVFDGDRRRIQELTAEVARLKGEA